eukprot:TRINITY_DN19587_c0_g1_i1.p1 TRINITY_DN19587_c0_g1~~TRINITY_DN19587_c0_g1_i1.p1  ORF type:complete len:231 (-),score=20.07 TRINITY_DN19587_c0_g1_i1:109-762(-)
MVLQLRTIVAKQTSFEAERSQWAAQVRDLISRNKRKDWTLDVDPPLKLNGIRVALVEPKFASNVGSVARAMNCFECAQLVLINPQCDHLSRAAMMPSKGAQHILQNCQIYDTLESATKDQDGILRIAFTRWAEDHNWRLNSLTDLLQLDMIRRWSVGQEIEGVLLVFGREYQGLTEEEVKHCHVACKIPIGRLQESLSISHAVAIPLSRLYEIKPEI